MKEQYGRRAADAVMVNRPVAVIEIGSSSVRMIVAQVNDAGQETVLDFLSQTLTLGNDTFAGGSISSRSIEECVRSLLHFRGVLEEYRIVDPVYVRIVATTAVREAFNREAFLDRIFIATGFNIEVLDEVDIARLMYLSWRSHFSDEDREGDTILAEIGGGNTDLLHVENGRVASAQTYRLGALRLRRSIGAVHATVPRQRQLIETQVMQTVDQISRRTTARGGRIVTLGGDMRFAAERILGDRAKDGAVRVTVSKLRELAEELLSHSVNDTALRYHIPFSDAETLGPALLFYVRLAEAFDRKTVLVADVSIRHGLLLELARKAAYSAEFREQVIAPALEVGRKYHFDEAHGTHVAALAVQMYKTLLSEHNLGERRELILRVASLLHDIGTFISTRSHHKHSMYVIQNTELFGLSKQDILLTALVARYHRRNTPKPIHEGYGDLPREERIVVAKLAAILRVADALDSARKQRFKKIECAIENGAFVITVPVTGDITLEQLALANKGGYFTEIYGLPVVLRKRGPKLEQE